jgi:hypothetical protein
MGFFNFGKKLPTDKELNEFWNFFKTYSPNIISGFDGDAMTALNRVDAELKKVCSEYKGDLEFELGRTADGSKYEFNFFHLRKPYLVSVGKKLRKSMPNLLKVKWKFNILA